jgi:hypothetical protein
MNRIKTVAEAALEVETAVRSLGFKIKKVQRFELHRAVSLNEDEAKEFADKYSELSIILVRKGALD